MGAPGGPSRSASRSAQDDLDARLLALRPWQGTLEQLVDMTVPRPELLQRWKASRRESEAALSQQRSDAGQPAGLRALAPRKPVQHLRRAPLITDDSGMAEFYIAVDAKGRVAKFWVLDAVPGIAMAGQLDGLFRNARFNADELKREGFRFGLQTITFSNQKLDLNRR